MYSFVIVAVGNGIIFLQALALEMFVEISLDMASGRFWDSDRMGRISPKFVHSGKARDEMKPANKFRPNLNLWPGPWFIAAH